MNKHYLRFALIILVAVMLAGCGLLAKHEPTATTPPTTLETEAPTTAPTEAPTEMTTEAPAEEVTEAATEASEGDVVYEY